MGLLSRTRSAGFAVVDVETTGLSPTRDRIVEIAVVLVGVDGSITGSWSSLINPEKGKVGPTHVHGIYDQDVRYAPTFDQVAPGLMGLFSGRVLVAHNAKFDMQFLTRSFGRVPNLTTHELPALCTMVESQTFLPKAPNRKLVTCCKEARLTLSSAHSALGDATATAELLSFYIRRKGALKRPHWKQALGEVVGYPHAPPQPSARLLRSEVAALLNAAEADEAAEAANLAELERAAVQKELERRSRSSSYVSDARKANLPLSGVSSDVDAYLQLLDAALEDRVLTDEEQADLRDLASALKLKRTEVVAAHRLYLTALAAAVVADGQVDPEERSDLVRVSKLLNVRQPSVAELLELVKDSEDTNTGLLGRSSSLPAGSKVFFHGEPAVGVDELKRRMATAGLKLVTRLGANLDALVVSDPDGSAEKTRWAREKGVRVIIEPVFLGLLTAAEVAASAPGDEAMSSAQMMSAGQNLPLSALVSGSSLRLRLSWDEVDGVDADVCAIALPASGTPQDEDLVFYNQPRHPSGGVMLQGKGVSRGRFSDNLEVDVEALGSSYTKVVLAASVDAPEGVTFASVPNVRVEVVDPGTGSATACFTLESATTETAVVFAEVYKHNDVWKVRAVGQGYGKGLGALVTDYGIEVS